MTDAELIETALSFALEVHRGQIDRSGQPYILHPLTLMMQMDTTAERLAAILHDTVEDSERTLDDIRGMGMPAEVVEAVDLLTHDKSAMSYADYVQRLKPNPIAQKVKLADLQHNMDIRRTRPVNPEDLPRLNKYLRAWETLTGAE
jgi:(p)ppGpp synthase/HD superfamily hydrolase